MKQLLQSILKLSCGVSASLWIGSGVKDRARVRAEDDGNTMVGITGSQTEGDPTGKINFQTPWVTDWNHTWDHGTCKSSSELYCNYVFLVTPCEVTPCYDLTRKGQAQLNGMVARLMAMLDNKLRVPDFAKAKLVMAVATEKSTDELADDLMAPLPMFRALNYVGLQQFRTEGRKFDEEYQWPLKHDFRLAYQELFSRPDVPPDLGKFETKVKNERKVCCGVTLVLCSELMHRYLILQLMQQHDKFLTSLSKPPAGSISMLSINGCGFVELLMYAHKPRLLS